MYEYTGDAKEPQCYNQKPLSGKEVNEMVKSLLGEPQENCNRVGLNPFYALNLAPSVNIQTFILFIYLMCFISF